MYDIGEFLARLAITYCQHWKAVAIFLCLEIRRRSYSSRVGMLEQIRVLRKFGKLDAGYSVYVGASASKLIYLEMVGFSISCRDVYH